MTRARRNDGGFLLAETLATFTISAFVLLGMVSAVSVLIRATDRTTAHVQDVDDLSRTMDAVARDVSVLERARWAGVEPQNFVFRGGPNSLYFAREQRAADGSGERRVIALREIIGGNGPVLTRSDAALPPQAEGFSDLRFGPPRALATGPARLRFYYIGEMPGGGERRAHDWPSGPILPVAILVDAVEAATGRLIVSSRIPIEADADLGCVPTQQQQQGITAAFLAIGAAGSPPAAGAPPPEDPNGPFCGRADKKDAQATSAAAPGAPVPPQPPAAP